MEKYIKFLEWYDKQSPYYKRVTMREDIVKDYIKVLENLGK